MLSLVIATSNAPAMPRPREDWRRIYAAQATEGTPPPNELAGETDAVIDGYIERIATAQAVLRDKLIAAQPDVVVVLGYDDGVAFSGVQVPQFCTFTGEDMTGSASIAELGESPADRRVTLRGAPAFAWEMHRELIDRQFDLSYMAVEHPVGRPEWGASSAFTRLGASLLQGLDLPVTPFFINCSHEPAPAGDRVHALGAAMGEVIAESDQKVAIIAVGGLSNDPHGPRAGWVDDRLDRWLLDQIRRGRSERLKTLFSLESDTLDGGTGQLRTWIAAAAAAESQGAKATIVDYIPALSAMTGLGFAYWDCLSAR